MTKHGRNVAANFYRLFSLTTDENNKNEIYYLRVSAHV